MDTLVSVRCTHLNFIRQNVQVTVSGINKHGGQVRTSSLYHHFALRLFLLNMMADTDRIKLSFNIHAEKMQHVKYV